MPVPYTEQVPETATLREKTAPFRKVTMDSASAYTVSFFS